MIWLIDDPDRVPLDRGSSSLWVFPDRWKPPTAARTMPAKRYLADPRGALKGIELLVIVGMSAIVTPANRVKTGPYLNEPWKGRRESVDRTLFVSEPWRAWWHWGCVGAKWDAVPHSFALEGLWNQYMDGRVDDPCSLNEFVRLGSGIVMSSIHTPRFSGIDVDIIRVGDAVHARYQEEKAEAFELETTWRGLLRRLGKFAQAIEPRRSVPQNADLFRHLGVSRPKIIATDLPVDTWIVERHRKTVALVDGIADAFICEDVWIQ